MMNATTDADAARFFATLRAGRAGRAGRIDEPTGLVFALSWWSARRDTLSLRMTAERAEAAARGSVKGSGSRYARYLGGASRAYLALAKGDSAGALSRLQSLDAADCMYPYCPYEALQTALLLYEGHRYEDAWKILDDIPNMYYPLSVRWRMVRARVAEKLNKREEARSAYAYVALVWRHADDFLQPEVREAEAALLRLGVVASTGTAAKSGSGTAAP